VTIFMPASVQSRGATATCFSTGGYGRVCSAGEWAGRMAPLDEEAMRSAAACLVGEHDFTSFRAAECQAKSPVRCMHSVEVRRQGDIVLFDFHANAFLHHMIRNLVGSLVFVGKGRKPAEWMAELLAGAKPDARGANLRSRRALPCAVSNTLRVGRCRAGGVSSLLPNCCFPDFRASHPYQDLRPDPRRRRSRCGQCRRRRDRFRFLPAQSPLRKFREGGRTCPPDSAFCHNGRVVRERRA
jgi:hypothetical protein